MAAEQDLDELLSRASARRPVVERLRQNVLLAVLIATFITSIAVIELATLYAKGATIGWGAEIVALVLAAGVTGFYFGSHNNKAPDDTPTREAIDLYVAAARAQYEAARVREDYLHQLADLKNRNSAPVG